MKETKKMLAFSVAAPSCVFASLAPRLLTRQRKRLFRVLLVSELRAEHLLDLLRMFSWLLTTGLAFKKIDDEAPTLRSS